GISIRGAKFAPLFLDNGHTMGLSPLSIGPLSSGPLSNGSLFSQSIHSSIKNNPPNFFLDNYIQNIYILYS
ncbi:MAG: hypothetical protein JW984_06100, partial [Deltaproteobacteria bacterium]|nr:hypothetical protein [Candidatus Zymogenus saltonus]